MVTIQENYMEQRTTPSRGTEDHHAHAQAWRSVTKEPPGSLEKQSERGREEQLIELPWSLFKGGLQREGTRGREPPHQCRRHTVLHEGNTLPKDVDGTRVVITWSCSAPTYWSGNAPTKPSWKPEDKRSPIKVSSGVQSRTGKGRESIWKSHEHQIFNTLPHLPKGLALPQKELTSYGCSGINPIFFHSLIHLTNPYTQLFDIRVKSFFLWSGAFLFPTTFLFIQRKRLMCISLQVLGQALTSQNCLDMSMLGPRC